MTTNTTSTTNVPLGTLIFRAGLLTEAQVEEALAESIKHGKRLGRVVVERGLVPEPEVARLLAAQRGLEFVVLAGREIDPAAADLIPYEAAWLNHAVPIGFADGVPVVAIDDPADDVVIRNVRSFVGEEARFVVATRTEILNALAPSSVDVTPPAGEEAVSAEPVAPTSNEPVAPASSEAVAPVAEKAVSVEPSAPNGAEALVPSATEITPPPAEEGVAAEPIGVDGASSDGACRVVVRLANGEHIDVGDFATADQATEEARAVVRRVARASTSEWPLVDGRFIRPDNIVSIDLVPAA